LPKAPPHEQDYHNNRRATPVDLAGVVARLHGVRPNAMGYKARCPVPGHGKGRGDRNPSLNVAPGDDGRVLVTCFAGCPTEDVLAELDLDMKDLFGAPLGRSSTNRTVYALKDISGQEVALHHRTDNPDGTKRVWWTTPGGEPGLGGIKTAELPLYGSERLEDWPAEMFVILVEGEKAANALHDVPLRAVGTVTGAAVTPSQSALQVLEGRKVILWPDNDDEGRKHMSRIGERLQGVAAEVRIYEWSDAPSKGDAFDHPAVQSRSREGIAKLLDEMAATPVWEQKRAESPSIVDVPAIETFTASDLLSEELADVRWAVPGLVPEGVTIFAGKPKMGKSWLALGMCVAAATGGVALGKVRVERGEVLYGALEDNRRRLHNRLRKLLSGGQVPEGLHLTTDMPRLAEGGAEALDGWLAAHPGCRLVVIDTLARIKPRTSWRSSYDEDRASVDPLIPIATKHEVAVVLVHHLREAESDDPLDMIHGSAGLTGGVDGALVLKRQRGKADAYLHVDGRDISEPTELALKWDADAATWAIVGDAEEYRQSETRRAIRKVLEESDEPLGPKEIADALDLKDSVVRQRLYQMSKDGEVKLETRGLYKLP
jgi:5S rRNA maturation endonuclease (ribonuclease M5)